MLSAQQGRAAKAARPSRRLLIVDDSDVIRSRLQSLVADLGRNEIVGMAADAREAVRLLREEHPDLVILDLRMPEGGGLVVLQEIKSHFPEITVVVLTNYPYAAYRKRCAELGADFFFDKTTEFEAVKNIL